jgi:hypothetical protein
MPTTQHHTQPPSTGVASSLVEEVCRRKLTQSMYVKPALARQSENLGLCLGHFWARTKASSRQTQPCLLLSLFSGHGRRPPNFPRDGLHGWPALWVRKKPGRGLPPRPPTRLGQEGGALGAHILGFPGSRWKRHRAQVTASTFCSVSVVSMDLLYLRAQDGRHSYPRLAQ